MKYLIFLSNVFCLFIFFIILSLFSSCKNKSKTDEKLGTQKNVIIQPYDTTNKTFIDSNEVEIKKTETKPISEVYDKDWGEPFKLSDTIYKESKEDSLQSAKNKQTRKDSLGIFERKE